MERRTSQGLRGLWMLEGIIGSELEKKRGSLIHKYCLVVTVRRDMASVCINIEVGCVF